MRKTIDDLAAKGTTTNRYAELNPTDRQTFNEVVASQKQIASRLDTLEGGLRMDASKALSVPLLRKDVGLWAGICEHGGSAGFA